MNSIFIVGTDTGVGKTHIAVSLIKQFNAKGYQTFGIKPIASGCETDHAGQLVNADALALQKVASIKRSYATVNPIALAQPIAPHLAAKHAGIKLSVDDMTKKISQSIQLQADMNIIEGVGGWSVPLNDHELVSDIIHALHIPVILVVGIKLGCLNHAILTSKSILQMQIPFIGWIANCIEPDTAAVQENIDTLKHWLSVPCLGVISHGLRSSVNNDEVNVDLILQQLF